MKNVQRISNGIKVVHVASKLTEKHDIDLMEDKSNVVGGEGSVVLTVSSSYLVPFHKTSLCKVFLVLVSSQGFPTYKMYL